MSELIDVQELTRRLRVGSDGTELTAADLCRVQKNPIWKLAGGVVLKIVERDIEVDKAGDTEQEPRNSPISSQY